MKIKSENRKRCTVVRLSGSIDPLAALDLERFLMGLIRARQKHIVVNMGEVDFLSPAGIKVLLSAAVEVREMVPSGDLVIAEIRRPEVKKSLVRTRSDRMILIFNEEQNAVGMF